MTNFDNLTEQESDDLLRQEIFAEEDSNSESGINDSEEQVDNEIDSHNEEVDTSEETTEEESTEAEQAEEKPKKKSNVAKILAEKNEYKRQALEAKREAEELRSKL
jgi:hypothetical protein